MALQQSKLNSQAFDLLRFPLTILVVCEHLFYAIEVHGNTYDANRYFIVGLLDTIRDAFFSNAIVPLFFLISGFLFFYNVDFNIDVYKQKIKRRIKTLLIPYLIWNTIALLILLLLRLTPCLTAYSNTGSIGINLSLFNILSCYWDNCPGITANPIPSFPINGPLWYIRDLMIVVVFAPIFHFLIKRFKFSIILLLGLIWLIFSSLDQNVVGYFRMARLSTAFFFFYGGGT